MTETTPGVRLARFATRHRTHALPPHVLDKTRVHLLDTLAAIISGSKLTAGLAGQRYVSERSGKPHSTIFGLEGKCDVIDAAFANGISAHADESDDSHETSQTHPGCGVVPAVLAVAEMIHASGMDLLRATALGYEVTIRFGEALVPCMSFARSSLSCHAFGPLFGAGFAVGSLLKFDETQFLILLNYLAQEASGLTTWRLDDAHSLKSYVFAGMPASNAVKCAMMVKSGFTGSGDVLGNDRNLFDAISPNRTLSLDVKSLDTHRILETDLKCYSVGFPIAAPLAALESVLDGREISAVRVLYHEDWYKVVGDANRMPDLNLRHCMAATMAEGRLSFDTSHDEERMKDPKILDLGRKISLEPAPVDQDKFEAVVEVGFADGTTKTGQQGLALLGRYQNPMSRAQSNAKATELLGTALKDPQRVIDEIDRLEKAANLDDLIRALR